MGVGDQPDLFAMLFEEQQEFNHKRMNGNQMLNLLFQLRDVEFQAIRPVVQVGPN